MKKSQASRLLKGTAVTPKKKGDPWFGYEGVVAYTRYTNCFSAVEVTVEFEAMEGVGQKKYRHTQLDIVNPNEERKARHDATQKRKLQSLRKGQGGKSGESGQGRGHQEAQSQEA